MRRFEFLNKTYKQVDTNAKNDSAELQALKIILSDIEVKFKIKVEDIDKMYDETLEWLYEEV